jgi:hypothetical protein
MYFTIKYNKIQCILFKIYYKCYYNSDSFYNFKEVQTDKVNKLVIDSTITNSCIFYDVCLFFQYLFTLRKYRGVRFKSYWTRTSLVRYDLNLTLGCHRFYYLAPLPVLDPIFLVYLINVSEYYVS